MSDGEGGGPKAPSALRMTREQRDALLEHCRAQLPYEGCGLLFGRDDTVHSVRPMRNAARSTTFFTLDPAEQLAALKDARRDGVDLIAIFHSHPVTRPYPSRTDIEFAAFWEECWFLIASFRNPEPELCAYRIVEGEVVEGEIEIRG